MDWSILFLNGKEYFFKANENRLKPLVGNPLTKINAHGHDKNHPIGSNATQKLVETFLQSDYNLLTLYPFLMHHDRASDELGITEDQLQDSDINHKVELYQIEDFSKLFNYLSDRNSDIIFVNHKLPAYNTEVRSLDRMFRSAGPAISAEELALECQNIYFSNSIQHWSDLGLNNIWDVRERLALDTRPLYTPPTPSLDFNRRHFFIDSQEWLSNGITTIKRIMDFCNLAIDNTRWDLWVPIYINWQSLHQRQLSFAYNLPHIIDSIINNWHFEIDLTFNQEVVVQHCLIYQHNLNLKTWQLEKFPNNTQNLHKLLEPNIHPLRDV